MKTKTKWRKEPDKQDYPAAESYLALIYNEEKATKLVKKLRSAALSKFKAKDIFRASGLPLLSPGNAHVKADQTKILEGEKISPLLLVRDLDIGRVIIADGYHRICAVYSIDEDAVIPCKII